MMPREQDEFDQQMIDLARVTRVMAGGKRMRFRACVVIGDRKGRAGWAVAKAADVSQAIQKAVARAKKDIQNVSIAGGTIPHEVRVKFKAARLILKPAKKGRGLIAGGVVRTVLDLAGIKDIVSKMYGSNNKINNVAATFLALSQLRRVEAPAAVTAAKDAGTTAAKKKE
ncbi:MAG: 30S ribosomal protein S5 [Patescibacteria group bacterium]